MAIRPLDMQVMVPKLNEVSHMKQLENQKSMLDQSQIMNSASKQTQHTQQSVVKSDKDEKSDNHTDAKDEGKNKYGYKPPKKEKKEDEPKPPPASYHKIDIKV